MVRPAPIALISLATRKGCGAAETMIWPAGTIAVQRALSIFSCRMTINAFDPSGRHRMENAIADGAGALEGVQHVPAIERQTDMHRQAEIVHQDDIERGDFARRQLAPDLDR